MIQQTNNHHEQLVKDLKNVGESLIINAESIVGNEKYINTLTISCELGNNELAPTINIFKSFYPEKMIEDMKEYE